MVLLTIDQVQHISVDKMQHTHEEEIRMLNEIDELAAIYEIDTTITYLRQSVDWIIDHINTMDNMTAMFISQQTQK